MVIASDQDSPPVSPIWTPTGVVTAGDYFMTEAWPQGNRSLLDLSRRHNDTKPQPVHLSVDAMLQPPKFQHVTFAAISETETLSSTESTYSSSSSYTSDSSASRRSFARSRPFSVHTNPKTPTLEEIAPALPESPDVATAAYHTPVITQRSPKNSLQRKLAPNLTESLELLVDVHHRRDADRLLAGSGSDRHSPLRPDVLAAIKRDSINRSRTSLVPPSGPVHTPLPPEPTVRGLGIYSSPNRGTESANAVYATPSRPERVARSASTPVVQNTLARYASTERRVSLLSLSSTTSLGKGSSTTTGATGESLPALPSLPEAGPIEHIASYAEIKAARAAAAAAGAQTFDPSAPPARTQMEYVAELELFDASGARVRFGDLLSQRTLVLFIRHWYSSSCAQYIRDVSRSITDDVLMSNETQVIIVGHGSPSMISGYSKHLSCPFPIYTDPTRKLQDALGILAAPLFPRDGPGRERFMCRLHRAFDMFVAATKMSSFRGGDRRQLGGEFIMTETSCTFARRMRLIGDHTPISEIRKAVTEPHARKSNRISLRSKSVNSVLLGPKSHSTAELVRGEVPEGHDLYRWESRTQSSVVL